MEKLLECQLMNIKKVPWQKKDENKKQVQNMMVLHSPDVARVSEYNELRTNLDQL